MNGAIGVLDFDFISIVLTVLAILGSLTSVDMISVLLVFDVLSSFSVADS